MQNKELKQMVTLYINDIVFAKQNKTISNVILDTIMYDNFTNILYFSYYDTVYNELKEIRYNIKIEKQYTFFIKHQDKILL